MSGSAYLTPAQHRVLQTLLHLTPLVPHDTLALAASDGRENRASSRSDLCRQHIGRIRARRPDLRITTRHGLGYSVELPTESCRNCDAPYSGASPWCPRCARMFKLGYAEAKRRFAPAPKKAARRSPAARAGDRPSPLLVQELRT